MASTLRVNTLEPYTGTDITIDADIIVNGDKTISGNLIVTGSVSVPRLLSATSTQNLGTDASGSNAAATSFTQVAPLSTGNATPAALVWQVGVQGASGSTPQTATEAFRVQEVGISGGSRRIGMFLQTASLFAGFPTNTDATLLASPSRFADALAIVRSTGAPAAQTVRTRGALTAPTQALSGDTVFQFTGNGYTDTATIVNVGQVLMLLRENATATTAGGIVRLAATRLNSVTADTIVDFRSDASGIREMVSGGASFRLIPGATQFAIRDSGNTADTFAINAAGTAITAPVATSITAAASALSIGLGATINETGADSDTRIEGDTDANLVFVDASTDRVGIGTATPGYKLDVNGTANATAYRVGGTAGASFGPGMPTSITVVNGIITAIS